MKKELKEMLNWMSYAKISSTGSSYDPAPDLTTSIGLTEPSWAISLSEDRDQGDRDCVHGRDLIAGKRYSS